MIILSSFCDFYQYRTNIVLNLSVIYFIVLNFNDVMLDDFYNGKGLVSWCDISNSR